MVFSLTRSAAKNAWAYRMRNLSDGNLVNSTCKFSYLVRDHTEDTLLTPIDPALMQNRTGNYHPCIRELLFPDTGIRIPAPDPIAKN
jgi:hypothetical protein